jgi:hypothetical protein
VLNTLVLDHCFLVEDAQVLCISNQTLSNLTISSVSTPQFSLFTPNLSFFDIGMGIFLKHLSSTCNFSFLQEVNMDGALYHGKTSIFLQWLQVLANVKILKLDICIIETILIVSYFSILSPLYLSEHSFEYVRQYHFRLYMQYKNISKCVF